MKTLDEVIKAIEQSIYLTDADGEDEGYYLAIDSLHYLKAYKDDKNDLTALRAYWKEQHENSPLTWDKLKQMEGKPVWVEFFYEDGQHFDSDWFLVGFVSESFCDVIGKLGTSRLIKNDYWQAYKKEQE